MATTAAILDVLLRADTAHGDGGDSAIRYGPAEDQSYSEHRQPRQRSAEPDQQQAWGYAEDGSQGRCRCCGAAYISISQAKAAVDRTQDLFGATINLKKSFGLSAKAASGFNAAVLSRGGEVSATAGAFRTLGKNIEEAGKGTESAVKAFRAFGVTQKELKTLSKDQLVFEISDGMADLNDKTRETAAATVLFGKRRQKRSCRFCGTGPNT